MANLQQQRLIKQCQITLGEDFWTDFIFEDVNFTKPSQIKNAYEKWQINYKDEYEIIQEKEGSSIDGRTKEFREKLKDLLYKKEFAITEKQLAGLKKKSEKSGIAYGILKKVFDRGMAAWKTGHRPGATPHQWAYARVNSFITGGKTRTTADADLWAKHKGKKEDLENSLYGEELQEVKRMKYKKVIAKLKDGEWDTSMDVKKRMHLTYTDNSTGKQKVVFVEDDDLDEAMKFWKVTIVKKAGKLFKGQNVVIKARNSAEAIKKGIKQMKGNPALVPGGSVTAELDEDKHSGPCWDTHKMVGMKKKKGHPGMVPNCVPRK